MSLILNAAIPEEAIEEQELQEWLDGQSFGELLMIRKEVEARIQAKKATRMTELRALIAENAAEIGVSVEELMANPMSVSTKAVDLDKSLPVPKYRDPDSGATWTGRGKPPVWMKAWIENGGNKEDLRIGATQKRLQGECDF